MRITFQQLRVFACVVKHKSLTKAARALYLTQPAVSNLIKQLEEYFEIPLIEYNGKKMFVTAAGNIIASCYEKVLANIEQLEFEISGLKEGISGMVNIALESSAKYFIPKAIGILQLEHPRLEVQLEFTTRYQVLAALQNNDCDFVIVSQLPEQSYVNAYYLGENPLIVIAHPTNPLLKKKKLAIHHLTKEKFLIREANAGIRIVTEQLFFENGLKPKIKMELSSTEAVKQAVMAGLGIAIVPAISAQLEIATHHLGVLNVKEFPLSYKWYAVTLKGKRLTIAAKQILDYLIDNPIIKKKNS